jgi:glutathione S-transferase
LPEIAAHLAVFDAAYGDRDYLVGTAISMADLFLAPILAHVGMFPEGAALLEKHGNIRRGQRVIRERPSFAATQPPLS